MKQQTDSDLPIQPVERPILCNPYVEPTDHWVYDRDTGAASHGGTRRPAGYWYKTERAGSAQQRLFTEENRVDLHLVNLFRTPIPVSWACKSTSNELSNGLLNRYKLLGTTAEVDFKTTRPCRGTQRSHIDQVVLDTHTWEATAEFRLESSAVVEYYARNDHLGFVIPYEYQGIDHGYEPDFLVRLTDGTTVVLEIKGYTDEKARAKHSAARRWVEAVNNWGELGRWVFHVCRNPLLLERELQRLASGMAASEAMDADDDRLVLRG